MFDASRRPGLHVKGLLPRGQAWSEISSTAPTPGTASSCIYSSMDPSSQASSSQSHSQHKHSSHKKRKHAEQSHGAAPAGAAERDPNAVKVTVLEGSSSAGPAWGERSPHFHLAVS